MKKMFALITAPVVLLLFVVQFSGNDSTPNTALEATPVHFASMETEAALEKEVESTTTKKVKPRQTKALRTAPEAMETSWYNASDNASSETLIAYALSLIGSPYVYGGTSSSGFDCSGFTSHVFQEFGVPVTRSSTTQSQDGEPVEREEAQPGDLVVFTGTNPHVREPGHVGIVISEPGDTITFVHSSSNGGVKISQVEGTGYEKRFLGIRRVM